MYYADYAKASVINYVTIHHWGHLSSQASVASVQLKGNSFLFFPCFSACMNLLDFKGPQDCMLSKKHLC